MFKYPIIRWTCSYVFLYNIISKVLLLRGVIHFVKALTDSLFIPFYNTPNKTTTKDTEGVYYAHMNVESSINIANSRNVSDKMDLECKKEREELRNYPSEMLCSSA